MGIEARNLVFTLLIIVTGCATSPGPFEPNDVLLNLRTYRFHSYTPAQGDLIEFKECTDGYSLTYTPENTQVCSGVCYVKTFGGLAPIIEVYLINNRYVAYPETIKDSDIETTRLCDMMAVTHLFDLHSKKLIYTSHPYQYNYNIPLVLGNIWMLGDSKKHNVQPVN